MMSLAVDSCLVVLSAAFLLAAVRLVRGPALEDRVVALDLLAVIGVGIAVVHAIRHGSTVILDFGIVLAPISFVGTVAFARFLARGRKR